jgi:hypothetical protein
LEKGEPHHPVPINKSENEYKKDDEEKEPIESPPSPHVTEPDKKEREKSAQAVIFLLESTHLKGFLLFDLGMDLLLLNKDSMTIKTDRLLIGCLPQIESISWASTHGTPV